MVDETKTGEERNEGYKNMRDSSKDDEILKRTEQTKCVVFVWRVWYLSQITRNYKLRLDVISCH